MQRYGVEHMDDILGKVWQQAMRCPSPFCEAMQEFLKIGVAPATQGVRKDDNGILWVPVMGSWRDAFRNTRVL